MAPVASSGRVFCSSWREMASARWAADWRARAGLADDAEGLAALLADPAIDGVYVATPHAQHGAVVRVDAVERRDLPEKMQREGGEPGEQGVAEREPRLHLEGQSGAPACGRSRFRHGA